MRKPHLALLTLLLPATSIASAPVDDYFSMSIEDLLAVTISTVSRSEESLRDTPAQVIVLSGERLRRRGYRELSEILDDLPGMDVVRVWGDKYMSVVWRGFRQTLGTPFLLLVDGQRMNQLYYADAEVMAALPLSNIERVEIVYGPGSVAHGADAFVGIINVITHSRCSSPASGFISTGSNRRRVADVQACSQGEHWRLALAARVDDSELDDSFLHHYAWTDPQYLGRRDLWGGFLDLPEYGRFRSPIAHRGLDLRGDWHAHRFSYQFYRLDTGYGLEYATDAVQPNAHWVEDDQALGWNWQHSWSEQLVATSSLRWRRSGINPRSDFLEGYNVADVRLLDFSHWGVDNRALEAEQGLRWHSADQRIALSGGLRFERQTLHKAGRSVFGPSLPVAEIDVGTYPFPPHAHEEPFENNYQRTRQTSAYLIGRYRLPDAGDWRQDLHGGFRHDRHSQFGAHDTLRLGYVGSRQAWTVKALYGESFQAPTPRLLYGGWQGAGSDPALKPHSAETWELSLAHQQAQQTLSTTVYRIRSRGIFRTGSDGAFNAGETAVHGAEFGWRRQRPLAAGELEAWTYYSWQQAEERDDRVSPAWVHAVDSVAEHKLQAGVSYRQRNQHVELRGRAFSARPTQAGNPAASVPGHALFDAAWNWRISTRLGLHLNVSNLLDRAVMHPGVYTADAGFRPGQFVDGVWRGSEGFFNSLLPQPGRQWELRLQFEW
jgi:outer membrane receptor for ferrienterochelin and colicins